jgi:hypothetical protein
MPKNTNAHGASYDGYLDVTPDGVTPEWVVADEVSRETPESEESTAVSEPVDAPRKPGRPKGSKNSTTAKAGNAAGTGSTRA